MQMHHMTDTPTARDHVHTARVWEADTLRCAESGWGSLGYAAAKDHWMQAIEALFGPQGEMR